jgi:16S rRNA processing protein RimM
MKPDERFFIAQIGKTVGLQGDLKIHFHTDFPKQFKKDQSYQSDRGSLEVHSINLDRGLIRFKGYESLESAKKLTNTKIYASKEQTLENCKLAKGEYFWFEIIGLDVVENGEKLGKIEDIQRILDTDYLLIQTDATLVEAGSAKSFLIPYIPQFIQSVDKEIGAVITQNGKDILEAS